MSRETVGKTLGTVAARERSADNRRDAAGNILLLGGLKGEKKTRVEEVLRRLNAQSPIGHRLTAADLKRFSHTMASLQKDFRQRGIGGGIHPRTVIDRSRAEDVKRFQAQINTAIPVRADKSGLVLFRVNAAAGSADAHHVVKVRFLNFQAAVASDSAVSQALARSVLTGAVRFDCDCGRHRFWYRYIATVGGYVEGRGESGFPKIRNPQLTGIACKHVLFVMRMLDKSPVMQRFMVGHIGRIRKQPNAKAQVVGVRQAAKMSSDIRGELWRNVKVRQSQKIKLPQGIFRGEGSLKKRKVSPAALAAGKNAAAADITRILNNPVLAAVLDAKTRAALQAISGSLKTST